MGRGWKNAGVTDTPETFRQAWTVHAPANLFDDATPGVMWKEFGAQAQADKYAADRSGAVVEQVERSNTWDTWKPNTMQRGCTEGDVEVRGRWTGRTYVRLALGSDWTYVELKVGDKLVWCDAR